MPKWTARGVVSTSWWRWNKMGDRLPSVKPLDSRSKNRGTLNSKREYLGLNNEKNGSSSSTRWFLNWWTAVFFCLGHFGRKKVGVLPKISLSTSTTCCGNGSSHLMVDAIFVASPQGLQMKRPPRQSSWSGYRLRLGRPQAFGVCYLVDRQSV